MAKSVVSPNSENVAISLINISDKNVKLQKNTTVASLQAVQAIENVTSCNEVSSNFEKQVLPKHLQPLLNAASDNLDSEQSKQLEELLVEFQDIFTDETNKVGQTDLVEHTIDVDGSKPIKIPPRRIPVAQKDIVDKELAKMLEQNVIEPSSSAWSSPIVLVTKSDGSIRFCIDFRKVNHVTKKDAYPLPHIGEALDTLSGSKYFCTLDMASGYWQIKMHKDSKKYTAFSTHRGLYQFRVMPFGLCNAPASFERLIERVLHGLQWEKCLCYLDDIIVFGKTFDQTLENLKEVFKRFREANLKLKPKKCNLFQTKVKYLGHVVSEDGISCDEQKVKAIQDWPTPKNKTEVQRLLGFLNYYRKFIPNFSNIAFPITQLTQKKKKFLWSEECESSFQELKKLLTSAPILAYPERDGMFILDTDGSNTGIGAVLSQVQDGTERVIAYASKTLNKSQQKYCTTFIELLAVVSFVRHFRHYLWGRKFLVRTDHASLVWLRNFKDPEGMLARWLTVLDTYDFTLQHRQGHLHANADTMSRMPVRRRKCKRADCPDCYTQNSSNGSSSCCEASGEGHKGNNLPDNSSLSQGEICQEGTQLPDISASCELGDSSPLMLEDNVKFCPITAQADLSNWIDSITLQEVKDLQQKDASISVICEFKRKSEEKPSGKDIAQFPSTVRTLWSIWESLKLENDVLYRIVVPTSNIQYSSKQLVAPDTIRSTILQHVHDARIAGHLGRDRTLASIKRRFYWPNMAFDVKLWCRTCDVCAKRKPGPGLGKSPLQQDLFFQPLDRIALDILGPLPITDDGNEYILVVGDYFTKWTEAYALADHTALTVADKLVTEFICRYGVPRIIHTDQGREFESNLFSEMCRLLGIDKTRTTPYNPRSDGMVERHNRTLQQMLSIFVNENRNDWDDHLPFVMMAYRSTCHDSTNCSPNLLMFGRETQMPIDVMFGNCPDDEEEICTSEYVEWLKQSTSAAFSTAFKNLKKAATKQKKSYDKGLKPRQYNAHDKVWRWYPPQANLKLGLGWTGPYVVLNKVTDVTYKIEHTLTKRTLVAHVDHLKPYHGRDLQVDIPENVPVLETDTDSVEQVETVARERSTPPRTPYITRGGRRVKPKEIFSPS